MTATPLLAPATAPEVDAIVALVESAFRGDASRVGWTTEADLLDGRRTGADEIGALVEANANGESTWLLVHRDGAEHVCSLVLTRDGDAAWFGMFAIKPDRQGGGLGARLLAAAEDWARTRWNSRVMRMKVIGQRTELIAWYERRGYRRTGHTAPFPYGDERFGLPRRDDLFFEVLEKPL